jgi:hypothetical protein
MPPTLPDPADDQRRPRMSRSSGLGGLALTGLTAVLIIACGTGGAPAVAGPLPSTLIGTWSSSQAMAETDYRFSPDGRYSSVEILRQHLPGGTFEFSRVQDGVAEVVDGVLVLRPTASTTTRRDPDNPGADYTDRPMALDSRSYTWRVEGSVLVLEDETGFALTLTRQDAH